MAEAARTLATCLTKAAPRRLRQAASQAAQYGALTAPWRERSRAMRAAKGMGQGTAAKESTAVELAAEATGMQASPPAAQPSSAAFAALVDLLDEHAVSWCLLAHPHVFPDVPPQGSLEEAELLALVVRDAGAAKERAQRLAAGPQALLAEAVDRAAAGTWRLRLSPRTAARRHVLPPALRAVLAGSLTPPAQEATDSSASASPASSAALDVAPVDTRSLADVAPPVAQTSTQTFLVCSSQSVAPGVFSPLTISAVTAWPTVSNVGA